MIFSYLSNSLFKVTLHSQKAVWQWRFSATFEFWTTIPTNHWFGACFDASYEPHRTSLSVHLLARVFVIDAFVVKRFRCAVFFFGFTFTSICRSFTGHMYTVILGTTCATRLVSWKPCLKDDTNILIFDAEMAPLEASPPPPYTQVSKNRASS